MQYYTRSVAATPRTISHLYTTAPPDCLPIVYPGTFPTFTLPPSAPHPHASNSTVTSTATPGSGSTTRVLGNLADTIAAKPSVVVPSLPMSTAR